MKYLKWLTLLSGASCLVGQILMNYWLMTSFGATVLNQVAILFLTFFFLGFGAFWGEKKFISLKRVHFILGVIFLLLGISFPEFALLPSKVSWLSGGLGIFLFLALPIGLTGFMIPRFISLFESHVSDKNALNEMYYYYHFLAAALLIIFELGLFYFFGIRGSFILVGLIFLLVGHFLVDVNKEMKRERSYPKEWKSFVYFSLLNGFVQVAIVKTSYHFFGPFPENFTALICSSLMSLSLAGAIQKRKGFRWTQFKKIIFLGLFLSFCWILVLSFTSQYFNQWLLGFDLSLIKAWRIIYIIVTYLPMYCCLSILVPIYFNQSNGDGASLIIAGNSWANGGGLIIGYILIGSFAATKVFFFSCLFLYGVFSLRLIRTHILCVVTLALFFCIPQKYFHLSYRFFEDPQTFSQYFNRIDSIDSRSFLGAQVDILSMGREKMLVIDGYKSVKLNQDGGFNKSELLLGSLQGFVGKNRDSALILGVGSGATVSGNARDYQKVVGVEIHPVIMELQEEFRPYNQDLLSQENVKLILDDGFSYLLKSDESFDLITNNVPTPQYSVAGQLWTEDFLKIVKEKLSDDGFYSQWIDGAINTEAVEVILKTIQSVFSYCYYGVVTSTYGNLFCFKNRPDNYYKKIESISNLMPYLVFPIEKFDELEFRGEVNSLNRSSLKRDLNPFLSQAWRKKKDWFLFDLLKINPRENIVHHCGALETVKLVKGKSLPEFCSKWEEEQVRLREKQY